MYVLFVYFAVISDVGIAGLFRGVKSEKLQRGRAVGRRSRCIVNNTGTEEP